MGTLANSPPQLNSAISVLRFYATSTYTNLSPVARRLFPQLGRALTKLMKTISIHPPTPICVSAFRSDTILPCRAAPFVILDDGYRRSRCAHSFLRTVRVFLSGLIDSSAFQDVSSGREVSIIFTSNGPLICRWESNYEQPPAQ